jgi:hypothetical protein
MWFKQVLGVVVVLAGSALESSCYYQNESGQIEYINPKDATTSVMANYVGANVNKGGSSGNGAPSGSVSMQPMAAAGTPYASAFQREPDGSFTQQQYLPYAPYSLLGSTPNAQSAFWSDWSASPRAFKNPAGWKFLADRLGVPAQSLVFANLLGNGTPVGLALVPANFNGGPNTPSLAVAIPNPDGTTRSFNF